MAGNIVWIDLEMTGLDIEKDKILEIACIVTDSQLNIVAEGPDLIIKQSKEILDNMSDWCIENHGKSGLTQKCIESQISLEEAEKQVLRFLRQHTNPKTSPLGGNSVYMDRMFLIKHMPILNDHMHYRLIDVSTIKEFCKLWNPEIYKNAPEKTIRHRALSDIKESINELKYYKENLTKF